MRVLIIEDSDSIEDFVVRMEELAKALRDADTQLDRGLL